MPSYLHSWVASPPDPSLRSGLRFPDLFGIENYRSPQVLGPAPGGLGRAPQEEDINHTAHPSPSLNATQNTSS
jgi:hypothetical protein